MNRYLWFVGSLRSQINKFEVLQGTTTRTTQPTILEAIVAPAMPFAKIQGRGKGMEILDDANVRICELLLVLGQGNDRNSKVIMILIMGK